MPNKLAVFTIVGLVVTVFAHRAPAQELPWNVFEDQQTVGLAISAPPAQTTAVPAGTHIIMALRTPLSSTSATQASTFYLETLYPVIQDNRIVIPAHTLVQGLVKSERRPGHFKRESQFRFHFTSMIFPNNSVIPIDGALHSIPGSRVLRVDEKSEGALKRVDQGDKALVPTAAGAVAGAIIGADTHFGIGKFIGAGLGAGLGLGSVLLVRGDDINLRPGVNVEIVLRLPISLSPEQAAFNASYIPRNQSMVQATAAFVDPDPQPQITNRRQQRRARPAIVPLFPIVF
jgi:hypothetical protein